MNRLTWETYTTTYSTGLNGKLGKWNVFSVFYDACVSKGSEENQLLNLLPPRHQS